MSRRWRKGYMSKKVWERVRLRVLDLASWRCAGCGHYGNEVDHIQPLTKGGATYDPGNLQVLCSECHRTKTSTENRGRVITGPELAWKDLVNQLN